jgi:hypothetical protein
MKTTSYSLMVVSPQSPRFYRVNISRQVVIIVAAFLLSFAITVALLTSFPPARVNEADRSRLDAENRALKIENENTAIGVEKLSTRLSQMEDTAKQITDLMNAAD